MKLNNKGFAITGILYGLLILFALLVGSYLTILTAKKNRLDGIVENIENEYNEGESEKYTLTIERDIGISTIYYKINDADTYTSTSKNNVKINVNDGDTIYYYGETNEQECSYIIEECSKNSECNVKIDASSIPKVTISAVTGKCLTIKKGPGVEKICYKVNNEKNFICKEGIDTISKAIKVGTNYYYYGVPSQNYTMTKCSENDKCSSSMPNHEEDLTLAAISNTSMGPFYVKIYVWDELQADGETSNGTFEARIFSNGDTSIYCDSPAIGTVDYSGNVTVTNITKDTSCYIG